MIRRGLVAACVALSGCALKGDVRRVELQVQQLREQAARADSARAVELGRLLERLAVLQRTVLDSFTAHQRQMGVFQGSVMGDLTEMQRQLVLIQELTGQSQQRLSEFRSQLEQRSRQLSSMTPAPVDTTAAAGPGPEQLYDLSLQQLRRGSPATARMGFQKFLQDFPSHDRVVDAQFFLGETWAQSAPDSAAPAYQRVVDAFPRSPRAPTALYRLGLLAEQRQDPASARGYYQKVLAAYPRSDEAQLARDKLRAPSR